MKGYKGFRVVSGKLVSLVNWGGREVDGHVPKELPYTEGWTTWAPKDSQGIFFDETIQRCISNVYSNRGEGNEIAIHEVTTIGDISEGWIGQRVCPAIHVGACVYQGLGEEIFKYKSDIIAAAEYAQRPKWRDVTDECKAELHRSGSCDGVYVRLLHLGQVIGVADETARICLSAEGYKVKKPAHADYAFQVWLCSDLDRK